MSLTLQSAARLLTEHHLLREIIAGDLWTLDATQVDGSDRPFADITYDTRTVAAGSLLCCKGRFKAEYLNGIDERGLAAYVAEADFSSATHAPGLIVNDARKAMSLLAAEFFGRPQDELTVIGITGTKGKTTTSYFTQAVLNAYSDGRCALFSSVDNCLDGHTYVESDLTTPENLDAFRMMRTAVDNGMRYLVMEVSSQAYKVDRVYGLTFDVGAFLNISPDHISPIEHPSFEDYLYCKRQIVANARTLVYGADMDHADLVRQDAAAHGIAAHAFALHNDGKDSGTPAEAAAWPIDAAHSAYHIALDGVDLGEYRLALDGDFNYLNAAAAVAIAHAAGVPADAAEALHAMEPVRIAGRMEQFRDPQSNTIAIVDYAHNYASVTALLDFVDERYGAQNPRITLVTGSAGNKAYDRRKEIVEAAEHRIHNFIFTAEDTDTEPFIDICMEMQSYITVPGMASTVISDRPTAVTNAIYDARAHADRFNIILIIGKGDERWIKEHNKHVPFEGDDRIVERMFGVTTGDARPDAK
ncbi:UDP-N-acetylmuramoylalanyl-D-glutamate--2, 6-diaminopimelate ligase [Bifidobacterium ramosum]|uniref:UDP-N-acetylmuramoyl-L-alanyl-D-glutamate--2, 6-diaminopimelate ligase n=1 Tax=Bifidobacterium ramosum TaxID=1798158 RepID=A0A6L4X2W7_9BIFI|nr:UDP-N-acetylmuramoyl-L-alanyl-D-glutamate--2,6-diaminopimelate ligase [Bifidobacterium ramosum]KAB8289118.1 UDP-N-acetylmuramoylalanyl-D-glutamate--2, 6-diaminopimelate ligase [Bifidobacterium ramosum]NEG70831.1 UDP-N-acetylmuramoyl-L-alanyl-D-glutamate--2,6-diaminopimelate ligase [Bifidobacterium ramosum]